MYKPKRFVVGEAVELRCIECAKKGCFGKEVISEYSNLSVSGVGTGRHYSLRGLKNNTRFDSVGCIGTCIRKKSPDV